MLSTMDREGRERRALAATATTGALLTVLILATSALMRLSTRLDGAEAVTTLAPAVETAVRMAHRLAAMAAGIAAAGCLVMIARGPRDPRRAAAVGAIVALTAALAVVGRYAPGYRYDAITVGHVTGGTLLACAFWWLRMLARTWGDIRISALPLAALAAVLAVSAMGAGAAAAALHGTRAFGPLHLWLAMGATALVCVVAWHRRDRVMLAAGIANVTIVQVGGGFAQLALGAAAAPWIGTLHALCAVVLAMMMVAAVDRKA